MKIFTKRSVPLLVTAVFMVMAVVPACAQKKGLPKGVKAVLGKKPPLTGTAPVVRPNVPRVPPTLPNATVATPRVAPVTAAVEQKVVQATAQAQTAAQIPQQKDFLTGLQALQTFRPGWKSELMLSGFTRQQLDLVEQSFKETDQFLFETDEAGNWLSPRSAEWNYTARYTKILTDNAYGELALNDGQIKTLFGKFSRLDDVFTWLNLQGFLLTHEGRAPKASAPGEEGKLTRHAKYNLDKRDGRKMNPEVEEYVYGKMPAKLKTPTPSYGPKTISPRRTPEQVWEEVTQFMREHNGEIPKKNSADVYESKLRQAWNDIYHRKQGSNDPYVQRLIKLHDEKVKQMAARKTPQEILDYMTAYMREHNGKLPSEDSQDATEKSYRTALNSFHKKYKDLTDTQVEELPGPDRTLEKLFRQEVKQYAAPKTPQEILDYMTAYMREHNEKLPSEYSQDATEKSYRTALKFFHRKYKDLTDAQVEELPEPERALEKLFRQEVREKAANKTPQEILDYMTAYMREHNGKLPLQSSQDATEKSYRKALNSFHRKYKDLTDAQVEELDEPERALEKLFRQEVKQYAAPKTPQEILDYMTAYMREHNGKLPLEYSQDATEKSYRKALNTFHRKYKDLTDAQVEELPDPDRALEKLFRDNVRAYNKKSAE